MIISFYTHCEDNKKNRTKLVFQFINLMSFIIEIKTDIMILRRLLFRLELPNFKIRLFSNSFQFVYLIKLFARDIAMN